MNQDNPQPPRRFRQLIANKKSRYVVLGSLAAVLVIVAVIIALTSSNDTTNKTTNTATESKYPNPLAVKSTLKVGSNRYQNPCQILPLKQAAEVVGAQPSADTYVQESALDMSITDDQDYVTTSCDYNLPGKTTNDVALEADQYLDADAIKHLDAIYFAPSSEMQNRLDALKTIASSSDAKKLLDAATKSLATYKQYEQNDANHDTAALNKLNPNGMVLPDDSGSFTVIYGNIAYKITLTANDYSDKPTATSLDQYGKILAIINNNALNTHLDQSPVPTILGNTDTIGSTKIVEPCVLLTAATFKAVAGQDQNQPLTRSTLPIDSNKPRNSADGSAILPYNECDRAYHSNADTGQTQVGLQIKFGTSVDQAKQAVATSVSAAGSSSTPVQTAADEAYYIFESDDPSSSILLFRVGAYIGSVQVGVTSGADDSDGSSQAGSQTQYLQAASDIITALKATH